MIVALAGTNKDTKKIFNKCKCLLENTIFKEVESVTEDANSESNFIVALNKDLTNLYTEYKKQQKNILFLERGMLDSIIETFIHAKKNKEQNYFVSTFIANQLLQNYICKYDMFFISLSEKNKEYADELNRLIKENNIKNKIIFLKGSEQDKIKKINSLLLAAKN